MVSCLTWEPYYAKDDTLIPAACKWMMKLYLTVMPIKLVSSRLQRQRAIEILIVIIRGNG